MQDSITRMRREVLEIPDAVARLLTRSAGEISTAAKRLCKVDPPFLGDVAYLIAAKRVNVFVTSDKSKAAQRLEHVRTNHPLTEPITLIASVYAMVERLPASRHLKKVTQTR
ncbi:hypothetical protein [Profundibacter sp.]